MGISAAQYIAIRTCIYAAETIKLNNNQYVHVASYNPITYEYK